MASSSPPRRSASMANVSALQNSGGHASAINGNQGSIDTSNGVAHRESGRVNPIDHLLDRGRQGFVSLQARVAAVTRGNSPSASSASRQPPARSRSPVDQLQGAHAARDEQRHQERAAEAEAQVAQALAQARAQAQEQAAGQIAALREQLDQERQRVQELRDHAEDLEGHVEALEAITHPEEDDEGQVQEDDGSGALPREAGRVRAQTTDPDMYKRENAKLKALFDAAYADIKAPNPG